MVTYFVQQAGTYLATGLSTDTKPASPPSDAMFIETDTGITFKVVSSVWVSTSSASSLSLGTAAEYVILCGSTLTNGVHDQLVTGNTGHVGTLTDTFTYVSGADVAGAERLGSTDTPLLPLGDAYALRQALVSSIPTFSYPVGAVDLATDVNTPDGTGIFKTGTYKITGAANIGAGGITLTGLGNFVFIITGALDTTAAAVITLANGASADNVFFVCSGIVTFGATTTFKGTVLAGSNAITTGANLNLTGRLISQVAVTIGGGTNIITIPIVTPSASIDIKQTEIDFGSIPLKMKKFTITDGAVSPSNQISACVSYDQPLDGDTDSAEWFEDLKVMARAGSGQFFLYANSPYADTNGKVKINYLIG